MLLEGEKERRKHMSREKELSCAPSAFKEKKKRILLKPRRKKEMKLVWSKKRKKKNGVVERERGRR